VASPFPQNNRGSPATYPSSLIPSCPAPALHILKHPIPLSERVDRTSFPTPAGVSSHAPPPNCERNPLTKKTRHCPLSLLIFLYWGHAAPQFTKKRSFFFPFSGLFREASKCSHFPFFLFFLCAAWMRRRPDPSPFPCDFLICSFVPSL